jgi:uncharacterized membrane protein YqhA
MASDPDKTTSPVASNSGLAGQAERALERVLFASRWLLAPIYLGLSLAILAIAVKFFQEIFDLLPHIFEV